MITPQQEVPRLAKRLGLDKLYFKREDLHPYKSHKGRSIPLMIETHAMGGHTQFAISSSGNAALAAIMYINDYNLKYPERTLFLQIFVGENISGEKLQMLKQLITDKSKIVINQIGKPKQAVHTLEKRGEAKSLRQSQDPLALAGYKTLADEFEKIVNLGAVFVPTSSGTTAEALAGRFQIHIVQPASCHAIAEVFDPERRTFDEIVMADAIVDRVALRKEALVEKIKKGGGSGWIVSNLEIVQAIKLARESADITLSPNAALALAGLHRALSRGWKPKGTVTCLITGK